MTEIMNIDRKNINEIKKNYIKINLTKNEKKAKAQIIRVH
jgi:hypothetical protein